MAKQGHKDKEKKKKKKGVHYGEPLKRSAKTYLTSTIGCADWISRFRIHQEPSGPSPEKKGKTYIARICEG